MPTISGFRRRGYTPESIHLFCEKIGVARRENLIDFGLLEFCIREDLNKVAKRAMAVLDPVKLIITNYDESKSEILTGENNPEDHSDTREIPFSKELWIEREDFKEVAEKKWFRLAPEKMVRLKSAFIVECDNITKDESGNITEIHCRYFPESRSGSDVSGLAVKGTIHWVSAKHSIDAEVRLYDRLFTEENMNGAEGTFQEYINPDSLITINAKLEPSLKDATPNTSYQFLRKGYFCLDKDSSADKLIFNRTVTLKDNWEKKK